MVRRSTFLFLFAFAAVFSAQAEVRFSIRYHNKNIYYPGNDDEIKLKLTMSNPVNHDNPDDVTIYLADDPRQSFGFDLRSLTGEPMPPAEGYVSSQNERGAYRVIHLAPGQELSITVQLNDWVDLTKPGQYRLTGSFYPEMKDQKSMAVQADSVLDLSVLPDTERRWEDELDMEVRHALIRRDLDPWSIVRETLENRRDSRYNRAMLYLDFESLARISRIIDDVESLENLLREGSWNSIPGFEHPVTSLELVSSQVFPREARVRLKATYEPHGEIFVRDLRFYLHNPEGYWQIRRVEALAAGDVDPASYGRLDLNPPDVISELLRAIQRGDWEIALRYYDTTDLVRNLPEYRDTWKNMSSTEHRRILTEYRNKLISGQLDEERQPLYDIDSWKITRVSYTDSEGSVTVENTRIYDTAEGPMTQYTQYIFRLEKTPEPDERWHVVRYDTSIIRR